MAATKKKRATKQTAASQQNAVLIINNSFDGVLKKLAAGANNSVQPGNPKSSLKKG